MFQKTILSLKFKFQVQDSFLEYFFLEIWRFEKRIALSEKKPPLLIDVLLLTVELKKQQFINNGRKYLKHTVLT